MKNITVLSLILSSVLSLTACGMLDGYGQEAGANGKPTPRFKNARGGEILGCQKEMIPASDGGAWLEHYGLPREIGGNFICENGKPKLPKDCQGREIRSEAQFIAFWEKHQLPIGLKYFECVNGQPRIPAIQLETWKQMERENPTCKDSRGHKRPCV